MIPPSTAVIFLLEQQAVQQTAVLQSRQVLPAEATVHLPTGLQAFNNELLEANGSTLLELGANSLHLLLPMAGAIACSGNKGNHHCTAAGQILAISNAEPSAATIGNPFAEHAVSYLRISIPVQPTTGGCSFEAHDYADVNQCLNSLVPVWPAPNTHCRCRISIGKFSGRGETVYNSYHTGSCVFVFVIEGAFEVEGRLLHEGDGLALWPEASIEMEALSNGAIILVAEMPLP